jgi:hypothetical protein
MLSCVSAMYFEAEDVLKNEPVAAASRSVTGTWYGLCQPMTKSSDGWIRSVV